MRRVGRNGRLWLRGVWLLAGLAAGAALLGAAVDVYLFSQKDEDCPADAAIVLGAGVYGERPSPVLRERINHAIALYREGKVKTIIFTGGRSSPEAMSEAAVSRKYALERGVPDTAVLLEESSTTTRENLHNAQQIAAANGLDSFLIVSTPYHMRRAMSIADKLGLDACSSPTRTIQWINGLTQFHAFAREVVAYLVYLIGETFGLYEAL